MSKLQEKPSALQNLENFCTFFNFCGPGYGSSRPKSMLIQADPDPKRCFLLNLRQRLCFYSKWTNVCAAEFAPNVSLFYPIWNLYLEIFGICVGGLTALGGSLADLPVDPQLGKGRLFLSQKINNCRTGRNVRHCQFGCFSFWWPKNICAVYYVLAPTTLASLLSFIKKKIRLKFFYSNSTLPKSNPVFPDNSSLVTVEMGNIDYRGLRGTKRIFLLRVAPLQVKIQSCS